MEKHDLDDIAFAAVVLAMVGVMFGIRLVGIVTFAIWKIG
jgi:hypothetical protein